MSSIVIKVENHKNNNIHISVLKERKKIGTIHLIHQENECELQSLIVDPPFQNQGIGSVLLSYCEDYCWIKGFESICSFSLDTAIIFFDKKSYITEGDFFEKNGSSFIKIRKNLKDRYETQYFTKIILLEIYQQMLIASPSFEEVFLASDSKDLVYVIASEFAGHVVQLFRSKENFSKNELNNILSFIENFISHHDEKVSEWAVIGILESIQNKFLQNELNNDAEYNNFSKILLSKSKKSWDSLNKFWNNSQICKRATYGK